AEAKDPLKWEDYHTQFTSGKNDKEFLEAYLEKASRLNKNNDAVLDVYISKYVKENPDDKTLNYLLENTKTLDNNALTFLEKHRDRINKLRENNENYFNNWTDRLAYGTLEKAVTKKDEKLLEKIVSGLQKNKSEDAQ